MLRLIGILIGSALAVGFLIVALGVPRFSEPGPADAGLPAAEAASAAVAGDVPQSAPAPELPGGDPHPEGTEPATEPAPAAASAADGMHPEGTEAATEPSRNDSTDATTLALIDRIFEPGPQTEPFVEENWYAFWSPFRSEIAANGFVARLQETTGIDYRVVRVKTGVYEVAFAYTDDADIQDKLARISSATGLDMSGS